MCLVEYVNLNKGEIVMRYYPNTYKPLCSTPEGLKAIEKYGYPRFVDHSIRREPDLQHEFPSITSICRGDKFAPRLNKNDVILYCTKKGKFLGIEKPHWCVIALLKVIEKFDSHEEAANWYKNKGLKLPSNCIVPGNDPLPLDHSAGQIVGCETKYIDRVHENSVFLICKKLYCELKIPNPIFKSVPSTQNPKDISKEELLDILRIAKIPITKGLLDELE